MRHYRCYCDGAGAKQLTQIIERIERLEEEKRALMADIKDVYAGAKATAHEQNYAGSC